MESGIGKRIKELREKKNFTQADLGRELNASDKSVSFWEKNGVKDKKLLQRISDYFGVSLEYLKEGTKPGTTPSTRPGSSITQMPAVVTVDSQGRDNIALVRVKARAGYRIGLTDPEYFPDLPTYRLPGIDHGTFRMFEVEGNSMYPTLKNRDLVIAEWVESPEDMRDERIYIIVTNDEREEGVIIKRCINRLNNPSMGFILAKSDAASKLQYEPIEIRANEIQEIWYARWYMSTQFTAPSDLYNRMTNLEVEMHVLKTRLIS